MPLNKKKKTGLFTGHVWPQPASRVRNFSKSRGSGQVGSGRFGSGQEDFDIPTDRVRSPFPGPTRADPRDLTGPVSSPDCFDPLRIHMQRQETQREQRWWCHNLSTIKEICGNGAAIFFNPWTAALESSPHAASVRASRSRPPAATAEGWTTFLYH